MLAQNPFTYYKGKEYKDIAAYRMKKNIDLNIYAPSTPILYERQVPEKQNTLSYEIQLPPYVDTCKRGRSIHISGISESGVADRFQSLCKSIGIQHKP